MLKSKFYLNIKLLTVVLCLISGPVLLAKDLDFSTSQPCNSYEQEYEINFDNANDLEWIIEGGEIVKLGNGNTPGQMCDQFMGVQYYTNTNTVISWLNTYNYTKFKFRGKSEIEATFMGPYGQASAVSPEDNKTPDFNNPLKKITIRWYQGYTGQKKITCNGKGLGLLGLENHSTTKNIYIVSPLPTNFSITASKTNLLCNEGVSISGAPGNADTYSWNTNGGVIQNSWNGGIAISRFTNDGIVPITVTVSNQCSSVSKTVTLNITQPDFGHVTQNNINVDIPGSLVTLDCQGNFSVGMPVFVSAYAVYTWELPGGYNDQTNSYTRIIKTGANVHGQMPFGALTDFVGKVTITGVCGAPVVKTFVVRPALRPTVDMDIYSCSNTVSIKVNNPTGTAAINAWLTSTPTGGSGTITNQTATSAVLTTTKAGTYVVNIGVNGTNGCYTELQAQVHAGLGGSNATNSSSGWQSGVLSDNRQTVGSNIVQYNGNMYFSGRDGKIYFYSYSTPLQKWVINQVPGITNAAVPAGGAFTKIGVVTISGINYLIYTDANSRFWKMDLATGIISDVFSIQTLTSEFSVSGAEIFALEKISNVLKTLSAGNIIDLGNIPDATLKTVIAGYGVSYIQNNNIFVKGTGLTYVLTTTNDVYASSDVVYYNGWVYFARGQKGNANLYRLQISNPSAIEQITTSANLSGVFTINPASGVIYYGVLNLGTINNIITLTSGTYKAADIYQARLQSSVWLFNKATTAVNYEGLDMYIQSPIYSGNHLYYIGAGRNAATTGNTGVKELEIWNLYYENGCAPAVQRVATDPDEIKTDVVLFPNPFNSNLSIDLSAYSEDGELTTLAVEVIDATGKSVYRAALLSQLAEISTGDWASGIYVIKVRYKDTVINKKAVKF